MNKIYTLLLSGLTLFSCAKPDMEKMADMNYYAISSHSANNNNVFLVNDLGVTSSGAGHSEETKTVLGNLRTNPFTVENMATAHRDLYNSSVNKMPVTHRYIKFMPADEEEYRELMNMDLVFYDYPLEYEVLEMGDYYQDITGNNFPVLYSIVKNGVMLPDVPYQVVDELYLDRSDPLLIAKSFINTGNPVDSTSGYFHNIDPNDVDEGSRPEWHRIV